VQIKTPLILLKQDSEGLFSQLVQGYGVGAREHLGAILEDSFKLTLVSNKLSLYEADIRKLRGEIDGRSTFHPENSNERLDQVQNASFTERSDGADPELQSSDGVFTFLKRVENMTALEQYREVIKTRPENCKAYFDPARKMYVAIADFTMIVVDLGKLRIEWASLETSDVIQVTYFQRSASSIACSIRHVC
jgi:hypothetical protein